MSAAKDYLGLPLREFLRDTAAKSATPGGGSVAALVGSLAASLGRMAIEYTVGKPRVAEHEGRLRELLDELGRACEMFTQLMHEDMAAYERFSAARKSADAEEQQRATATAVAVPLEIVVLAGAVASRCDEIKTFVNPYLFSDLQVAAILAGAAAESAATNVRVNLVEMSNRKEAERLESQLATLVEQAVAHRNAVADYRP